MNKQQHYNDLLSFDNLKECMELILKKNVAVKCSNKETIKLFLDTCFFIKSVKFERKTFYNFVDNSIFYIPNIEYTPRFSYPEFLSNLNYIILDFEDFIKLSKIKKTFFNMEKDIDFTNIFDIIKEYNLKVKNDNLKLFKNNDFGFGV